MRVFQIRRWSCALLAASTLGLTGSALKNTGQSQEAAPPEPVAEVSTEVSATTQVSSQETEVVLPEPEPDGTALMRGPVHEAFAEQFSVAVTPTAVINKEPPQPIEEVPPEFRPEGDNIQWIAGYWGWTFRSKTLFGSRGFGVLYHRSTVDSSYWAQVEDGWQWVSGFWTKKDTEELVYLPMPPETIEAGPSSPAPGDDYFWIPGNWVYAQQRYDWQPGYWSQGHEDWVWIPSRYVWTPSGCIYREGYWDYVIASRGTMFAPMRFPVGYGNRFRPSYVVETGPLWLANLFVLPGFNHYAFGNYYGYRGNRSLYLGLLITRVLEPTIRCMPTTLIRIATPIGFDS